jgi:quercetin dioxygenase-like cupin family protein
MKRSVSLGLTAVCLMTVCLTAQVQGAEKKAQDRISKVESRASIVVNNSSYKKYFTGDVRIDMLYPNTDTNTHGGAYVTFEPGARTNWHSHPAGQHIIVTSGVGYYQAWGKPIQVIKAGDVVWVPIGVKHWHGASKDIAMTHLVVTSVDENGKNAIWLEPVSDEQYNQK